MTTPENERANETPEPAKDEGEGEGEPGYVTDDQLPEDLRPDDNPLARDSTEQTDDSNTEPGGPDVSEPTA